MKLMIIGASGHGKVVADIAEKNGYDEIEFYDDNPILKCCGKWPIVGSLEKLDDDTKFPLFVAIGNSEIRKRIMEKYVDRNIVTLIHPNAVIAEDVTIGKGTVVIAGAVINASARIGDGCIINTCSSVGHDCTLKDYAHVAPGAHICGASEIGNESWIGAGSTVINNVNICDHCMLGAGTVVVTDITESGTYVGVPAKKIK